MLCIRPIALSSPPCLSLKPSSLASLRSKQLICVCVCVCVRPGMRILVTLLLDTLPMLGNVLLLCFFVFFIFGIVGVQLWAGLLRNRCFLGEDIPAMYNLSISSYYMSEEGEDSPFICSAARENGMLRCHDVPASSGSGGAECSLDAPPRGPDAIGRAAVAAATATSAVTAAASGNGCVNWNQYYNICRPGDVNPHKGSFSETKQRENALMREQRARYMSNDSTLASYSEPGSCYEEMLRYISHLYRKLRRRVHRIYSGWHSLLQHHQHHHCHLSNGGQQHGPPRAASPSSPTTTAGCGLEELEMRSLVVRAGSGNGNGNGSSDPPVVTQGMGALLGRLNGGMNYPTILPSIRINESSEEHKAATEKHAALMKAFQMSARIQRGGPAQGTLLSLQMEDQGKFLMP
ncbi:hypothetical protein CRUP_014724 [Coryphaenoides rupestris]|nr:hypothetical protein CRUP_014724 [Coryphaenoides rupestris]